MRIYLDHNATSPLHAEVIAAMTRALRDCYGNPSSVHVEGARAGAAVSRARDQVARCLGTQAQSVYFTAGATEANNTVLQQLLQASAGEAAKRAGEALAHLVTTQAEHPSVLEPSCVMEQRGVEVTRVPVDADGLLDPAAVADAIRPDTKLVSILWANNETGVVQPMQAIAEATRARGVPLHVDATQAIGKWPVDLALTHADYLSCSAHKFNGPKGVGCLVVADGRRVQPLLHGGPQERRWRGGTENVASIVGFGVACEQARLGLQDRMKCFAGLRDRLWRGIESSITDVRRNGSHVHVLPNTLNVEFCDTAGEVLLQTLDVEGVAVSAGAACHSGSISPSHVLTAMGRSPEQARGCLRFSVGLGNDEAQIDRVLELLPALVDRVRSSANA